MHFGIHSLLARGRDEMVAFVAIVQSVQTIHWCQSTQNTFKYSSTALYIGVNI